MHTDNHGVWGKREGREREGRRESVCVYLVCLFAEETIGAEDLTNMQIKLAFLCRSGLTVQRDIQIGVRCRCWRRRDHEQLKMV